MTFTQWVPLGIVAWVLACVILCVTSLNDEAHLGAPKLTPGRKAAHDVSRLAFYGLPVAYVASLRRPSGQ